MPVQQPANSGALAVLADVAGNAREEMEVATQLKVRAHLPSVCPVLRCLYRVRSHVTFVQAAPCGNVMSPGMP